MDSRGYLQSYGWKEGEALRKGGLRKPILVKHKHDTKGIGHGSSEGEAWWERVFDGQLKSLNVSVNNKDSNGTIKFKQGEVVASGVSKSVSPLYRMFVRGEGLAGTIGQKSEDVPSFISVRSVDTSDTEQDNDQQLTFFDVSSDSDDDEKKKKHKKSRSKSKDKKDKKFKKEKKDKKDKNDKKGKRLKKDKNDKKGKRLKKDIKDKEKDGKKSSKKRKSDNSDSGDRKKLKKSHK